MSDHPSKEQDGDQRDEGVIVRRKSTDPSPPAEEPSGEVTEAAGEPVEAASIDAPEAVSPDEATPPPPSEPVEQAPAVARRTADKPLPVDSGASFGELLEGSLTRGGVIEQGEMIEGRIVAISGEWAFVDLGGKTEGILAVEEIQDEGRQLTRGIGDSIEAFVVSTSGGEIRLSFALGRQIRVLDALEEAYHNGIPVEGRVEGTNKGGFNVSIGGRRAFCPISQIDLAYTEDPSVHLNKTYQFRIIELRRKAKRLVVSRAALLREELAEKKAALRDELYEGAELDGVVTSLQEYGAFVDLGGIEGLVHISELSWGRVEHPSEVLKEGDHVTVRVLEIRETDKGDRVSLSIRQTQPHPWVAVGTKFVEGETYRGTVTRLEPFGAFVELGPGVEGLVHVSELSWERRVNHPSELLTPGEPIDVYLKSIDHDRQRLSLSVKALKKDPWQDAGTRYAPGSQVTGTVEKVQPFGVFVEVEPGLVALLPASESGTGQGTDLRREFQPGKSVTATVLSVEPGRRRMSLSLKAADEARDQAEIKEFLDQQDKGDEGESGFGTLGDLFADKLK